MHEPLVPENRLDAGIVVSVVTVWSASAAAGMMEHAGADTVTPNVLDIISSHSTWNINLDPAGLYPAAVKLTIPEPVIVAPD